MYAVEIKFFIKSVKPNPNYLNLLNLWIAALRFNGQITGYHYPAILHGNEVSLFFNIPEENALDKRFYDSYANECEVKMAKKGIVKKETILKGKNPNGSVACKCSKRDSMIMYTSAFNIESPIKCGDCFRPIPLYRLKNLKHLTREQLIRWKENYGACDLLFINSEIGEEFSYNQLSHHKSQLSESGIDLREEIEDATRTPVFYYLLRYSNSKEMSELIECPSCGNEWILDKQWLNKFDFKCNLCRLISIRSD